MTTVNDMTFKIAGAAGQGVESSGAGFSQATLQVLRGGEDDMVCGLFQRQIV